MARSVNSDPLLAHNFALIDVPVASALPLAFPIKTAQSAIQSGTFVGVKSIDIPEMTNDAKEIRELNGVFTHKVPSGYTTCGDATIEMAVFNSSLDMFVWFMQVAYGQLAPRRSILVVQFRNDKLIPQRLTLLHDCFPTAWKPASTLDATDGSVVMESLTLSVHRVTIVPLPVPLTPPQPALPRSFR